MRSEPTKSYFDEIATGWEKLREGFFSDRVREKAIGLLHQIFERR